MVSIRPPWLFAGEVKLTGPTESSVLDPNGVLCRRRKFQRGQSLVSPHDRALTLDAGQTKSGSRWRLMI